MSIRCVCANGHVLKVKESLAGTSGLCPVCRGRVDVPQKTDPAMSEEAIMSIIGTNGPTTRDDPSTRVDIASHPGPSDGGSQSGIGLKKMCERCEREITVGVRICPYCHTYIAKLRDF
jgi:hypothetical protein